MLSSSPRSPRAPRSIASVLTLAGLALGVAAPTPAASAQVSSIVLQYFAGYRQNTPAAPTAENGVQVFIGLSADNPTDLTEVAVTRPDEVTDILPPFFSGYALFITTLTKAEALAIASNGEYLFSISGGTLGAQSGTVTQPYPQGNWPGVIPALTPASYTTVQGLDPSATVSLTFAPVTGGPGANIAIGTFSIYDITSNATVFDVPVQAIGTTSVTIPGGTLQPAHAHRMYLTTRSQHSLPNALGTAPQLQFAYQTFIDFQTGSGGAGCPADFSGDGLLDPDDLADFITCYFSELSAPGNCPAADFSGDGTADPDDLSDYITAYFTGCA